MQSRFCKLFCESSSTYHAAFCPADKARRTNRKLLTKPTQQLILSPSKICHGCCYSVLPEPPWVLLLRYILQTLFWGAPEQITTGLVKVVPVLSRLFWLAWQGPA